MQVSSLGNPLVYQLSQVLKSGATETNRHLQQVNADVENTKQAIMQNAVDRVSEAVETKGRIIDFMV